MSDKNLDNSHPWLVSHFAYNGGLVPVLGENVDGLAGLGGVHRQHHADAHVEDVEHLPVGNLAVFLKEAEDRKNLPSPFTDLYSLAFLEDPRDVLVETAAGDVGDSMDIQLTDNIQDLLHIDSRRGQRHKAERLVSTELRLGLMQS